MCAGLVCRVLIVATYVCGGAGICGDDASLLPGVASCACQQAIIQPGSSVCMGQGHWAGRAPQNALLPYAAQVWPTSGRACNLRQGPYRVQSHRCPLLQVWPT